MTAGTTYGFLEAFTYQDLEAYEYQDMEGAGIDGIGERFEILGPFDAPTMTRLINEGLRHCWIIVEVACVPTLLTSRHDLTAVAPWPAIDPGNLLQVGLQANLEDRNLRDPFEQRIFRAGRTRRRHVLPEHHVADLQRGDTIPGCGFSSEGVRPLPRRRAGNFGDQQGLLLETDESRADGRLGALPQRYWWLELAAVRTRLLEPAAANQRLIRDQQSPAVASFNDLVREHLVADMPQKKLYRRRSFGPAVRIAR